MARKVVLLVGAAVLTVTAPAQERMNLAPRVARTIKPGVPPPRIRVMSRTPQGGVQRPFENIVFENFRVNGQMADWRAFNFSTNTAVTLR